MIVTQSLARGAVRAAAARHSEAAARAYSRLVKSGVSAPATLRRYSAWFRKHQGIFERDALLIALGGVSRRGGAFCAYSPAFEKSEKGWELGIRKLRIEFVPGDIVAIDEERMPVRISGHALERMFQRINTIDWPVIRDCLASVTHFLCAVGQEYAASGLRQCAIPADLGMLVGQVDDGELILRTFLPDSQLSAKWQTIYDDLRRFCAENGTAMERAALVPDPGLRAQLRELIASGKHQWLRRAYVPGEDPLEDAWRSRLAGDDSAPTSCVAQGA
jgi:hypothetical protein